MAGQFKFVAVVYSIGSEPLKVIVCPDYAAQSVMNRMVIAPEVTTKIVEIESYWTTTILHAGTTEDTDGQ